MRISTRRLLSERETLEQDFREELRLARVLGRPIERRRLMKFIGYSVALFGGAGPALLKRCSSAAASPSRLAAQDGDIVITFANIQGPEDAYEKVMATDYLKEHPEIKDIVFDTTPYNNGLEKQLLELSSGQGGYDLLWTDEPWLPAYADAGYIIDVREDFKDVADPDYDWDDFHPAPLAAGQWNDTQFGFPHQANTLGMAFRKDVYDELGLPEPTIGTTWAEFEENLKKIHDPSAQRYGFTSWHQRGVLNTADYMTVHHSMTPPPENQFWNPETWEPMMNGQVGQEALEYYVHLMDNYMPPGPTDIEWTAMITAMQQGQAGNMINWTASFAPLEDPAVSKVNGKIGWTTPPAGTNGQPASHRGVWVLTVNKTSQNPEATFKFAEYLTDKAGLKTYSLLGGFGGRTSLFDDPEINEKYPYYAAQLANFDAAAKAQAYRPRIPEFDLLIETVNRNLSRALIKELTPKDALDAMAKESGDLLKQLGYWSG